MENPAQWPEHPAAPAPGQRLIALAEIPDGQGREVVLPAPEGGKPLRLMVLRVGDTARAYVNACRHFGVPLNVRPDHPFVDPGDGSIVCQVHYARYAVEDGRCLGGDCEDRGLAPVPVCVRDGQVCVAAMPGRPPP
ncbi:Rieske (2Fe-2S) protein [Roseospirillum parvum]|uniref:Ferredoxin subunit of nitrite reductase or a ring-hydroxylating dioxygenase n=1 Tax=Roseospirillum parvum TaxID=83401 RepID=A0A1G7V997_9PROT|nr:Rieske 2Fe-2S domain-containing protein [Roseospirillum parvum]SDG56111.1 Ferredoxin subunit of nitrite reductase or a ring-hydroxylating dioxygenase [Roseospirillum parvum]